MESRIKNKKKIPKSIHEMSKEKLEETLKKKKECNAKAQEIVEAFCEQNIDETMLLNNLQYINQSHYDDVTVERAILKLCGYPLCNNKIEKIINQQYHISLRYNKVFDVTERKNFCSSSCFKASNYIRNQLFTSPLWFRDQETIPKYSVLNVTQSSLGKEIVFFPDKISLEKEDIKKTSNKSKASNSTNSFIDVKTKNQLVLPKNETEICLNKSLHENNQYNNQNYKQSKCLDVIEVKSRNTALECNENFCKVIQPQSTDIKEIHIDMKSKLIITEEQNSCLDVKKNLSHTLPETVINQLKGINDLAEPNCNSEQEMKNQKPPNNNKYISAVENVESSVFEWFSLDTLFFLHGEKKLKKLFNDSSDQIKKALNSKLSVASYDEKIEKMIKLYGLLESTTFKGDTIRPNLKPLPDYSAIQEESKSLNIKVKAFYSGNLVINESPAIKQKDLLDKEEINDVNNEIYLPPIDSQAQNFLRRKIILDKLSRILPDLIKIFSADYVLQMSEVRKLVSTFTLSAYNITFKPTEWRLVGLILIKLLSLKDKYLDVILKSELSQEQLALFLKNCGLNQTYLSDLVNKLFSSQNIINKIN